MKQPDSTEGMVLQLWHAIIGTNGKGLIQQFIGHREEFKALEKKFHDYIHQDREETCYFLEEKRERGKARFRRVDIVYATITLLCVIMTTFIAVKAF